jgi:hypothetical protein
VRLRGIENEANLVADDVPMGITLRFDVATNLIEPRRGKTG